MISTSFNKYLNIIENKVCETILELPTFSIHDLDCWQSFIIITTLTALMFFKEFIMPLGMKYQGRKQNSFSNMQDQLF